MTNKKFKVAAMSMALTACVAAQPLIANAADDVNVNSNDANVNESHSEGESTASAPVAAASVSSDPVTNQQSEGAVDVIGDPDISVDYTIDGFASPFALRRKKCVGCFRFFSIFDVSGAIVIVGA